MVDSLKYCQLEKGLEIFAYVLMPSHLHMLCRAKEGHKLADIVSDLKKFTSKAIIENVKSEPESRREWILDLFAKACAHLSRPQQYKVWQDGYHAMETFSNSFIFQKLSYIHNNPVVDGLVEKPEDYLYSSARNYAGLDGLLEVEVLHVNAQ